MPKKAVPKPLEQIQYDVCQWSRSNFGAQESKAYPDLILGSLAPLLGLIEETGEYFAAGNEEEIRDALADVGIYLCDYAGREGIILPEPSTVMDKPREASDAMVGLVVALGKLCHCTLKRHQGIRGFDVRATYESARNAAVEDVVFFCTAIMEEEFQDCWLTEISNTWDKIVAKRNWKTDSTQGLMDGPDMMPPGQPPEAE